MRLKLTVLIENQTNRRDIKAEHGLSFLLEADGKRILFDVGSSGAVWENGEKLGLLPGDVDILVLSHNHYDHAGGFRRGVEMGLRCRVICGEGFFEEKYRRGEAEGIFTRLDSGLTKKFAEEQSEGISFCGEQIRLTSHCYVVGRFKRERKWEHISKRYVRPGESGMETDPFEDEVCLVIEETDGMSLGVICGCSHPGIVNVLKTVKERFPGREIDFVAGGIHLMGVKEERAMATVRAVEELGVKRLFFNHCTDDEVSAMAKIPAGRLRSGDCMLF